MERHGKSGFFVTFKRLSKRRDRWLYTIEEKTRGDGGEES